MEKYEIMDVIDEGAYGIVWKAINKQTNSIVAIKEFKQTDEDEFSKKTIQRQIKMLKMLKGQFVVGIKQAFKKKGKIYLIFQYFQHNLLNLIERYEHGLDPQLINVLVYKIIKCLQYLHSKNIIHRDVKPENLLINADYSILKICDFGFARFMPEKQYDLTEYVATRWYRSPELLVGEPYGKAADMWAVGCMIGQLVDGQPMFPGDDEVDQIHLINKLVGNLTSAQEKYFSRNAKFQNIELPQVVRGQTLDIKYLGKIQKNALSFMKACLKMNPSERITVDQALKHPYLINLSMQDNQFADDQQNLLQIQRKNQVKNESKVSVTSKDQKEMEKLKEKQRQKSIQKSRQNQEESQTTVTVSKHKLPKNHSLASKKGLKLQGGSMNQRDLHMPKIQHSQPEPTPFAKKKSHNNLHTLKLDEYMDKPKHKKLNKIMSQQKNLKLNLDVNLKINLKINQKQRKQIKDHIESKLQSKLNLKGPNKDKFLPDIRDSNNKRMRYHLNVRHQKPNQLISVIGQTKQLIRGSKMSLHQ